MAIDLSMITTIMSLGAQALTNDGAKFLAAGLAIGIGVIGPGVGIGILGSGAMGAIGRNPEAAGAVTTNMILAIAFAEALGIYSLIVAVILLFVV